MHALGTEILPAPAFYPRLTVVPTSDPSGFAFAAVETPNATTRVLTLLRRLSAVYAWKPLSIIAADANASAAPDLSNPQLLMPSLGGGRTLLCTYRHHTNSGPGGSRVYTVALSRSLDKGFTWEPLAVAASAATGLWEPFLFEVKGGMQLGLAYAAEITNGGEQDIVLRFSNDGGRSWSAEASRIHTAGSRNGMPGVAVLPNGYLLAIFEGFWGPDGWGHFTVNSAISNDGGATWPQEMRQIVHAPPAGRSLNAGSPQVAACPAAAGSAPELCSVFMSDEPGAGVGPWPAGASILSLCAQPPYNWSAAGPPQVVPTDTATGYWPSLLAIDGALHATYQTPPGAAQLVSARISCAS